MLHLAYYDHLTNLYNYQKFKEEGQKKLKDKHLNWAVIYSDIAGFKIINDLNGYEFGDKVLKELANILKDEETSNDLTCHMTADKFLMMREYGDKQELIDCCQRIYQKLSLLLKEYGLEKEIVIKFGICCLEDDDKIEKY